MVGCCKLPGTRILCACSCPRKSGRDVPASCQQDKYYSVFCNFLSLCQWKSVIPLKVRALKIGYTVYLSLQATFLTSSKSKRLQRLKTKKRIQYGVRFDLPYYSKMFQRGSSTKKRSGKQRTGVTFQIPTTWSFVILESQPME